MLCSVTASPPTSLCKNGIRIGAEQRRRQQAKQAWAPQPQLQPIYYYDLQNRIESRSTTVGAAAAAGVNNDHGTMHPRPDMVDALLLDMGWGGGGPSTVSGSASASASALGSLVVVQLEYLQNGRAEGGTHRIPGLRTLPGQTNGK